MTTCFVPVPVDQELPNKPGKYLVFTQSTIPGIIGKKPIVFHHRLETTLTITKDEEGIKHSWNVNNQKVTHWLKEVPYEKVST